MPDEESVLLRGFLLFRSLSPSQILRFAQDDTVCSFSISANRVILRSAATKNLSFCGAFCSFAAVPSHRSFAALRMTYLAVFSISANRVILRSAATKNLSFCGAGCFFAVAPPHRSFASLRMTRPADFGMTGAADFGLCRRRVLEMPPRSSIQP